MEMLEFAAADLNRHGVEVLTFLPAGEVLSMELGHPPAERWASPAKALPEEGDARCLKVAEEAISSRQSLGEPQFPPRNRRHRVTTLKCGSYLGEDTRKE